MKLFVSKLYFLTDITEKNVFNSNKINIHVFKCNFEVLNKFVPF